MPLACSEALVWMPISYPTSARATRNMYLLIAYCFSHINISLDTTPSMPKTTLPQPFVERQTTRIISMPSAWLMSASTSQHPNLRQRGMLQGCCKAHLECIYIYLHVGDGMRLQCSRRKDRIYWFRKKPNWREAREATSSHNTTGDRWCRICILVAKTTEYFHFL